VLRAHVADDFEPYAAVFASDHARFMEILDRRGAWGHFCSDIAQWALFGFGAWAVEDRATGAFLGQIAIQHPDHFPEIELGWFVLPQAQGQGLAFEAAQTARDWAFGPRGLDQLVSYIDSANARSIALAERLGAALDPNAERPDPEDFVYRHRRAA